VVGLRPSFFSGSLSRFLISVMLGRPPLYKFSGGLVLSLPSNFDVLVGDRFQIA